MKQTKRQKRGRGRILGDTERKILLRQTNRQELHSYDALAQQAKEAFNNLPEIITGFATDLKILLNYPPTNYAEEQLNKNKKAAQEILASFGQKMTLAKAIDLIEGLEETMKKIDRTKPFKLEAPEQIKKGFKKAENLHKIRKKIEKNSKLSNFFLNTIGAQIDTTTIPPEGTKFVLARDRSTAKKLLILKKYGLTTQENKLTQDGRMLLYILKNFASKNNS